MISNNAGSVALLVAFVAAAMGVLPPVIQVLELVPTVSYRESQSIGYGKLLLYLLTMECSPTDDNCFNQVFFQDHQLLATSTQAAVQLLGNRKIRANHVGGSLTTEISRTQKGTFIAVSTPEEAEEALQSVQKVLAQGPLLHNQTNHSAQLVPIKIDQPSIQSLGYLEGGGLAHYLLPFKLKRAAKQWAVQRKGIKLMANSKTSLQISFHTVVPEQKEPKLVERGLLFFLQEKEGKVEVCKGEACIVGIEEGLRECGAQQQAIGAGVLENSSMGLASD